MPLTMYTIICCQSYVQIKMAFPEKKRASLVCNSEFSLDNRQTLGSSGTLHLYFHVVHNIKGWELVSFFSCFTKNIFWVKLFFPPLPLFPWVVVRNTFIIGPFWFYSLGMSWGTTSLIHHCIWNAFSKYKSQRWVVPWCYFKTSLLSRFTICHTWRTVTTEGKSSLGNLTLSEY